MLAIKTVSAPVLSSGAYNVTFGQFEKVTQAHVSFDDPFVAKYLYAASRTLSTNIVTVTIKKQNLAGVGAWANAGDSDITGTLTVVAEGE